MHTIERVQEKSVSCGFVKSIACYAYSGDGLKRREFSQTGVVTTLVWDGSEYLQERD